MDFDAKLQSGEPSQKPRISAKKGAVTLRRLQQCTLWFLPAQPI
jgi:hypothetical protein